MNKNQLDVSRRSFLRYAGIGLGSVVLASPYSTLMRNTAWAEEDAETKQRRNKKARRTNPHPQLMLNQKLQAHSNMAERIRRTSFLMSLFSMDLLLAIAIRYQRLRCVWRFLHLVQMTT